MSSDVSLLGASCPVPLTRPDRVLMGHGSGGRLTAQLIEEMVLPALSNPALAELDDHAVVPVGGAGAPDARVAFTTDSYVVTPLFFPGGDIGELAVNGTVNDLAMGGARPLVLSLAFIIEEGLPLSQLGRVIESARRAEVQIVTGDTKVVGRGSADGLFVNTSGIGILEPGVTLGSAQVRPGDAVLLSGTIGDHGVAIMTCREGLELHGDVASDTAPLGQLAAALRAAAPGVHAMRDPTRGGVAATLVEISGRRNLGIEVDETAIPVRSEVRGACELLGLDPLLVANEGKLVAFVPEAQADRALAALRAHPLGTRAARIGTVTEDHPGVVVLDTAVGGRRILDLPLSEPLPRIC